MTVKQIPVKHRDEQRKERAEAIAGYLREYADAVEKGEIPADQLYLMTMGSDGLYAGQMWDNPYELIGALSFTATEMTAMLMAEVSDE